MNDELRELDYKEMGRRIRSRRDALGLTRESLAEKLDVSSQFMADIEYGNKGMSIKKLYRLCQILGVTADYVLAGNLRKKDADGEAERVREEIMATLQICGADQLSDVKQVAWIFADRGRRKK